METREIIQTAILLCASEFNSKDVTMWSEKLSHSKMADDLSKKLEDMGYRLEKFRFFLEEETVEQWLAGE